jgi:hypothetical protein
MAQIVIAFFLALTMTIERGRIEPAQLLARLARRDDRCGLAEGLAVAVEAPRPRRGMIGAASPRDIGAR